MEYQQEPSRQTTSADPVPAPAEWTRLIEQIHRGELAGIEELYRVFARGIRLYLLRNLGPHGVQDRMRDVFLMVVQAVQRGELRESEQLIGFIYTVLRGQIACEVVATAAAEPGTSATAHPEVELIQRATEVVGLDRVSEWLQTPVRALGGRTPYSLISTAEGRDEVEIVLGRIEHGLF